MATDYWLLTIFYFLLGTAIGSFLNVWSRRLLRGKSPTGRQGRASLLAGRSHCEHCGRVLGFFDLIPLLSFALLRGRCRYCDKRLSWQYPIVEFGTGILFAALWLIVPKDYWLLATGSWLALAVSASALIVIFITDISAQVIFDQTIWVLAGSAFLYRLLLREFQLPNLAADLLAAVLVFLLLLSVRLATRKRGLGDGDPPLGFAAALLVGFPGALVELFWAFVAGGAVGAVLVLSGKNKLKDQIAFGPFLVTATFITLFWGEALLDWYLGFLGL